MALAATAGEPGSRVERVTAVQRPSGLVFGVVLPSKPQDPVINVNAGLHSWLCHMLSPKKTDRQAEERGERAPLQQAMVGTVPPFRRVGVHREQPELPAVESLKQGGQSRRGTQVCQGKFQDGHGQ